MLDPELAATVKDEEIVAYTSGKLASYKSLAAGIRRVESIPRSVSGKILKKLLREEAKKE